MTKGGRRHSKLSSRAARRTVRENEAGKCTAKHQRPWALGESNKEYFSTSYF